MISAPPTVLTVRRVSGAFRAAQFGFSALDGVGCSEAGDELREIVAEGAFEQALCSCEGVKLGSGSVFRWFNRRSRGWLAPTRFGGLRVASSGVIRVRGL